jgi:4-hydroxyphenylacetate 3-hydroxylase-like protein
MLRSGQEHLQSLRDGRVVYVGAEKIDDVTSHPAFRNAAQTVAALYDMKADPAYRDELSYEEDGGRHSIYFLRALARGLAAVQVTTDDGTIYTAKVVGIDQKTDLALIKVDGKNDFPYVKVADQA